MIKRRDDPDAHDVILQGDVPEPADLAGRLQHQRGPGIAARLPHRPLPVRPDRRLLEHRIPLPQTQTIEDQSALTGGIDDHLAVDDLLDARLVDEPHALRSIPVEEHLEHPNALVHIDAVPTGVVEQQVVELLACDLPGPRTLMLLVIGKVKRLRHPSLLGDELHAVLFNERATPELWQHPEPLEHPECLWDQRLSDVIPREPLSLVEPNPSTVLRQQRRRGRAGRTTADDHHLWIRGAYHPASSPSAANQNVGGPLLQSHPNRAASSIGVLPATGHAS